MASNKKQKQFRRLIYILSIVIPVAVAMLFEIKIEGVNLRFLPKVYATINGITAVLLILALVAIKAKKIKLHQRIINACLLLSICFLGCYVAYHITSDNTAYEGSRVMMYRIILISHILLSVAVIPIVLFTYLFAYEGNFEKHKKWTKIAWPIWFYVATTGVIVYYMISPYYIK